MRPMILAVVAFCALGASAVPASKVYGGTITTEFEFPFLLSFQRRTLGTWDHLCGAALIDNNWAVTSAGCLANVLISNTRLAADWSFNEISGYETYRDIATTFIHPNYSTPGPNYNDVALLKVSLPFNLVDGKIGTIPLPTQGQEYAADTAVTVTGWGASGGAGLTVDKPRKADMPVIDDADCRQSYGSTVVIDSMICTGRSESNIGPCGEDKGGPLFTQNPLSLVGIVSWDWGCNLADYPPVFTQLSYFTNWINSVISENP